MPWPGSRFSPGSLNQKLRTFVCDRLAEGGTPEQFAGWLKAGNERGFRALGFEAIYVFIYRAARKGEDLWRYLTRRHKRRRPRRARPSRDTIKDRASIHDRPKDIEARADIGHWEGDLIICKRTRPMLVCDAYASWQKGGVENANGRLRRWLPRHIDIDKVSDEEIQDVLLTANLTPRKCLGFKTPFQGILKELGKDVQIRFS
jgi:IS30 family transposase